MVTYDGVYGSFPLGYFLSFLHIKGIIILGKHVGWLTKNIQKKKRGEKERVTYVKFI